MSKKRRTFHTVHVSMFIVVSAVFLTFFLLEFSPSRNAYSSQPDQAAKKISLKQSELSNRTRLNEPQEQTAPGRPSHAVKPTVQTRVDVKEQLETAPATKQQELYYDGSLWSRAAGEHTFRKVEYVDIDEQLQQIREQAERQNKVVHEVVQQRTFPKRLPQQDDQKTLKSERPQERSDSQVGSVLLWSENFEGSFPNSKWCDVDDDNPDSGDDYWDDTSYRYNGGSWSCYCADISDMPDQTYDNNMEAVLESCGIDVSGYVEVDFDFWLWYETESNFDFVFRYYSGDGSNWGGGPGNGSSYEWTGSGEDAWTIGLNNFSTYYIKFVFISDASVTMEGAYVDDLEINTVDQPTELVPYSYIIDDDDQDQSSGNGNGLMECGEVIEYMISLENIGSPDATNVYAYLSTDDPCITMLDDYETFPDIAPDAIEWCIADFDFEIGDCQGHNATFYCDIYSDQGSWSYSWTHWVEGCPPIPPIEVTYPNGGEHLDCGPHTITWTGGPPNGQVKILYWCDNQWHTLVERTNNDGAYDWAVPNGLNCMVKIEIGDADDYDNNFDQSDGLFQVACGNDTPSITLTSPNGGEQWGCNGTVRWTSSNFTGTVNIDWNCNNGAWSRIASNQPANGSYNWSIPQGTVCNQARVRVSDSADGLPSDVSDSPFSISCSGEITVMPECGVLWAAGSKHKISWTPFASNVKLQYSTNGGSTWSTIVSSLPDAGCYDWTTPSVNSAQCKIRVSNASNTSQYGESSLFTIGNGAVPYLQMTDIAGQTGARVTAMVNMNGNRTPFDAFGLTVNYDTNFLRFVQAEKGDQTQDWIQVSGNENSSGAITVGGFHTTALPTNSNGSIVKLIFEVTCSSCGECDQSHLGMSNLSDDAASMTAYCGTYSWGSSCVLGDVNMDDAITPGDALCAFNIYLNGQIATGDCNTECALTAADANCDGTVTPGDALIIFDHYLSGQPIVCPTALAMTKQKSAPHVRLGDVAALPGQSVRVPIVLDNPAGLAAFGLEIDYPENLLDFVSISPTAMTSNWLGFDADISENGTLIVGGYHNEPVETSTQSTIAELVFEVKENAHGSGTLDIINAYDDLAFSQIQSAQLSTDNADIISSFSLEQNYPNPFNMNTEIHFAVPEEAQVTIEIFNLAGKKVRTLTNSKYSMGRHSVSWNGQDQFGTVVTSGVYLYKLQSGSTVLSKKLMLLK